MNRQVYFSFTITDYVIWLMTHMVEPCSTDYAIDVLSPFMGDEIRPEVYDILFDFVQECYPVFDWEIVDRNTIHFNCIESCCRVEFTYTPLLD